MRRRLPPPIVAFAAIGAVFVSLPAIALATRAPWGRFAEILSGPGARIALRLSLEVSLAATACSLVLGVPIAWVLARGAFRGRAVLRALVISPIVLPPVVAGVGLLMALGRRGIVGTWLERLLGVQLTFTTAGAIVAATFVSMPLVVLAAEAGFRGLDPRFEQAAAVLGARPGYTLRRVVLPMVGPQLVAGAVLAWARALGEFGATITFAGNLEGRTQTVPLAVFQLLQTDQEGAIALSLVLVVLSIAVLVALRGRIDRSGVMGLDADVAIARGDRTIEVAFTVADGETVALLGRNGAGKTTALEAIAGTVPLVRGHVELGGRRIEDLPAEERGIGVSFQDAILFPKLSVLENVSFPLRARATNKVEARARAAQLLEDLAPDVRPDALPTTLSGGERQRVALARALIADPELLLLDEPFASVDAAAKPALRALLRRTLESFRGPKVLVTHDPIEATTLADRLVLLEDGRVTQVGTPAQVRDRPATRYAAELVGTNLFTGTLEPDDPGAGRLRTDDGELTVVWPDPLPRQPIADVQATLSPSEISLHAERPEGSPRNVFRGAVEEIAVTGGRARIRLRTSPALVAELTTGSVERLGLRPGSDVWASCKAVEVRLMVPGGEPDTL